MCEQMRPENRKKAPDPSNSYERAHPENEAGMGRLDNDISTPTDRPDQVEQAVSHRQKSHQINAEDSGDQRNHLRPDQPQHSMNGEEPLGWDQAPEDIHNPQNQHQPKTGGKGGTP